MLALNRLTSSPPSLVRTGEGAPLSSTVPTSCLAVVMRVTSTEPTV